MTAPAPEKNPAAAQTAGLETAVQRQREGSADPSKREPTTAAGAVEKAAPIPADVLALIERLRSMGQDIRSWGPAYRDRARADMLRAAALLADRASQEENPRPAKTGGLETAVLRQPQEERIREKDDDTRLSLDVEWEERIREDERDALFLAAERAKRRHIRSWIGMRGGMFPADRARQRGDAS